LFPKTWELVENIVRQKQPQDDVDTIECMRAKYGDNGGQIHQDSCFTLLVQARKHTITTRVYLKLG